MVYLIEMPRIVAADLLRPRKFFPPGKTSLIPERRTFLNDSEWYFQGAFTGLPTDKVYDSTRILASLMQKRALKREIDKCV